MAEDKQARAVLCMRQVCSEAQLTHVVIETCSDMKFNVGEEDLRGP